MQSLQPPGGLLAKLPQKPVPAAQLTARGLTPWVATSLLSPHPTPAERRHLADPARYSWKATPGDDPHRRHHDKFLVDRNQGYEVLAFINWFAHQIGCTPTADARQIERSLLRAPSTTRSFDNLGWFVWNDLHRPMTLMARGLFS